jgi:hypothetical protein
MRRTTAVALVSMALVSTAAIVGVYFLRHKPEPSPGEDLQQRLHEEKTSCLEAGGTWIAGKNADGLSSMTGYCEHSEPTTPAPVVASPSSVAPAEDGSGGGNPCFLYVRDCPEARSVRHQVYKSTGYSLHMPLLEIILDGRATCRALGPKPTDPELFLRVAANMAQTKDIPQNVALQYVAALYANFC